MSWRPKELVVQTQPNSWSCLPTAFAIAIGKEVNAFIEAVGHDGSEIWFPDWDEPRCRRSFHIQEMVDVCLHEGYSVTPIERQPLSSAMGRTHKLPIEEERLNYYLLNYSGVLVGVGGSGTPHAVAWNGLEVYDPNGSIYDIDKFDIWEFFIIEFLT